MKKIFFILTLFFSFVLLIPNTYCVDLNKIPDELSSVELVGFNDLPFDNRDEGVLNNLYRPIISQCSYNNYSLSISSTNNNISTLFDIYFSSKPSNFNSSDQFTDSFRWYLYSSLNVYVDVTIEFGLWGGTNCYCALRDIQFYNFDKMITPFDLTHSDDFSDYVTGLNFIPDFEFLTSSYWYNTSINGIFNYLVIDWSFDFSSSTNYFLNTYYLTFNHASLLQSQYYGFMDCSFIFNDDSYITRRLDSTELYNMNTNYKGFLFVKNLYNSTYSSLKSISFSYKNSVYIPYNDFPSYLSFGLASLIFPESSNLNIFVLGATNITYNEFFGSSLFPIGSNSFYVNPDHWYDIGSHIYNLFIYIIFDAPILSDILSLFGYVISIFISLFEWLVSLFGSVTNTIFISIFLGFVFLKFIFNFVFRG